MLDGEIPDPVYRQPKEFLSKCFPVLYKAVPQRKDQLDAVCLNG